MYVCILSNTKIRVVQWTSTTQNICLLEIPESVITSFIFIIEIKS